MKHKLFTVYDCKACAFLPPFCLHADALAKRVFGDCVNDRGHAFGKHPEDYTLFRIGEFDDTSGVLLRDDKGISPLGNGIEFIREDRDGATLELPFTNGKGVEEITLEGDQE